MKTRFITTRFPEDLAERLKEEAKKSERSAGAVIRLAVSAYLDSVQINTTAKNKRENT